MMNSNQVNPGGQYPYSTAMSIVNNQPLLNQSMLNKCESQQQINPGQQTIASVANVNQAQLMQRQFTIPIQLSTTGGVPLDLSSLMPNGTNGCITNTAVGVTTNTGQTQQIQINSFPPNPNQPMQINTESYTTTTTPITNPTILQNTTTVHQLQQQQQAQLQQQQQQQNTPQITQMPQQINTNLNAPIKTSNNSQTLTGPGSVAPPTPNVSVTTTPKSTPKRPRKDRINSKKFRSVAVQTAIDVSLFKQQVIVVPPKNCTCGAASGKTVGSMAATAGGYLLGNSGSGRKYERKKNAVNAALIEQTDPFGNESDGQQMYDNRGRPFAFKCFYCPKRFSLNSRLVAHTRCHTGIRPFSCLVCGYSFTQRSYLNRHAAVHKQERPFTCEVCHKTYKHYGSLANHRKLHTKSDTPSNNKDSPGNNNNSSSSIGQAPTNHSSSDNDKDDTQQPTPNHSLSIDSSSQQQQLTNGNVVVTTQPLSLGPQIFTTSTGQQCYTTTTNQFVMPAAPSNTVQNMVATVISAQQNQPQFSPQPQHGMIQIQSQQPPPPPQSSPNSNNSPNTNTNNATNNNQNTFQSMIQTSSAF